MPSGSWTAARGRSKSSCPLSCEFDDYAIRISEMLGTLAEAEQRSQSEILRDILAIFSNLSQDCFRQDKRISDSTA